MIQTYDANQFDSASRWLHLGTIKLFQPEDYVMVVIFVSAACIQLMLCLIDLQAFYTTLIVTMNIVAHLDTNLMLPSDIPLLTPESIKSRIRGSKLVLVVEQCMIMTIWGCKICLLLMYSKLTFGLKQQWAAKAVGAYVVINWIIMESLYFGVVRLADFFNSWCCPMRFLFPKAPLLFCPRATAKAMSNIKAYSGVDLSINIGPCPLTTTNVQQPSTT